MSLASCRLARVAQSATGSVKTTGDVCCLPDAGQSKSFSVHVQRGQLLESLQYGRLFLELKRTNIDIYIYICCLPPYIYICGCTTLQSFGLPVLQALSLRSVRSHESAPSAQRAARPGKLRSPESWDPW